MAMVPAEQPVAQTDRPPCPWTGSAWDAANPAEQRVLPPGTRIDGREPAGPSCYRIELGLAATHITMERNRLACVGLAGPGALIGLDAVFGDPAASAQTHAVVEVQVVRIPAAALRQAMQDSPGLRDSLLQYLQAQLTETQHIAACNARHLLPKRCAHWLLRLQARLGDVLPVTHEFLATALGVRRAGVTVTLQALQRGGAIRQQRGRIVIVSADRLRQEACSCPIGVTDSAHLPMPLPAVMPARPTSAPADPVSRAWIDPATQMQLQGVLENG